MDALKIYISHLKEDAQQTIDESVSPDFIELSEKELRFDLPVQIKGTAYLTSEHLIVKADIKTKAFLPCAICNQMTPLSIEVIGEYYTIPLASMKKPIYYYGEKIRETILLQIPSFIECNKGCCPSRKTIKKYLKDGGKVTDGPEVHYPFKNLG